MRNYNTYAESFEYDQNSEYSSERTGCDKYSSTLEKILVALLTVALILFAVMGYYSVKPLFTEPENTIMTREDYIKTMHLPEPEVVPEPEADKAGQNISGICLTKECIIEASTLIDSIDESINPCSDFYEFACNGFQNTHVIKDDALEINLNQKLETQLVHQIKELLEAKIEKNSLKSFQYTRRMYQSCMNMSAINKIGLKQMKNLINILGGWPVTLSFWKNEGNWSWTDSVYAFRATGLLDSYFLKMSIFPDLRNTTNRIIDFDEPTLGLQRENYLSSKGVERNAYLSYMVGTAQLFGANVLQAQNQMREVLSFEVELAKIMIPREDRRNESRFCNPMKISTLNKRFPFVNWLVYINTLLPPSIQVNEEEWINVESPEFLYNLGKLLGKTKPRVLANYHMWRAIKTSSIFLSKDVLELRQKFRNIVMGEPSDGSRGKFCTHILANSGFSVAIASMYVRSHTTKGMKESVKEIYNYILKEFLKKISNSKWMDKQTKKKALEKVQAIKLYLAYPDELLDDAKVESIYKGIRIKEDYSPLVNDLYLTKHMGDFEYGNLRKKTSETHWIEFANPAVINAYYTLTSNSLELPAGILQGTNFNAKRPAYLNFGTIGWTIAHELIHSMDDEGRQFNKDGNVENWWKPETEQKFTNRTKCFIEEYSQMTIPEFPLITVNGVTSLGETIADAGGIRLAYKAYLNWIKDKGSEKLLPGLTSYSPQQLFWMAAAGSYCSKTRKEALKMELISGEHPPDRIRIIGSFRHAKEFARDWKCKPNSNMVAKSCCEIW